MPAVIEESDQKEKCAGRDAMVEHLIDGALNRNRSERENSEHYEPQMAQGLMYRRTLAPDAGMLFDYGAPQPVAFWMKNTLIPLDMIFIGADGAVVDVHERAVPLSLDPIESKVPARAVLEVNGGTVARLGLKVGDVVHYAFFGNAVSAE